MEMDIDQKIYREFAVKYGYNPDATKQLSQFVKSIHHFTQYLGAHKYYSDALNKRIAFLALDADSLALKLEAAKLESEDIYTSVELALFSKKKPDVTKARIDSLKATLESLRKEALGVHGRALALMDDVRREYATQAPRAEL